MRTVSKSATFLATESVNSAPFKRGETEVIFFLQNSSLILSCKFMAMKNAKLIANFSATMASWLPSISLCISLSLSLSLCHRAFLKHNIGSASTQSKPQFIQESTWTASSGSTWLCVVHHDPAHFSLCRQAGLPSNLSKTISVALIICIAVCFGLSKVDCCRVSLPFALTDSFFLSFK